MSTSRRTTNANLHLPLTSSSSPPQDTRAPSTTHTYTSTSTPPAITSAASTISQRAPKPLPRPEALWHEMQHKLSEVELSNTAIFFGPKHARALEELRAAQIALAQAWMVDQSEDTGSSAASTTAVESESDVLLAKKRRLASDAHFEQVAAGVLDVAAKLESVASATRGAEMESRGIWENGSESVDGWEHEDLEEAARGRSRYLKNRD